MVTHVMRLYQKEKEAGNVLEKIWEGRLGQVWVGHVSSEQPDQKYKGSKKDGVIQTFITLSHGYSTYLEVLGLILHSFLQSEFLFWVLG